MIPDPSSYKPPLAFGISRLAMFDCQRILTNTPLIDIPRVYTNNSFAWSMKLSWVITTFSQFWNPLFWIAVGTTTYETHDETPIIITILPQVLLVKSIFVCLNHQKTPSNTKQPPSNHQKNHRKITMNHHKTIIFLGFASCFPHVFPRPGGFPRSPVGVATPRSRESLWEECKSWDFLGFGMHIWGFPSMGVPPNGWFIMEHPIKIDDLEVPLFQETTISPISMG